MKRLRKLRRERGLSATQLGFDARVHPATISQLELGRLVPPPTAPALARLARALGWRGEPAALLDDVGEEP